MASAITAISNDGTENSSVYVIKLDELEHAAVRTGIAYWQALRAGRKVPARSQLSPRDMAGILRNVVLVKVVDGGRDYEYRIAGDAHVQAFTVRFKNLRLSQLSERAPGLGRILHGLYEHVRTTGEPLAVRGWVDRDLPETRFMYYESALLPLSEDGETVDHVLVVSIYVPKSADF